MIAATHPVTPEEVMAFLDGELAPEQVQSVSEHVEQCKECAALMAEFRDISRTFFACTAEAIPESVEKRVTGMASRIHAGMDVGHASVFIRASLWSWRKWAVVAGAAATGALLIAAIAIPNFMRTEKLARARLGVLPSNGRDLVVALNSPGAATDSNGLLQGPGDRIEKSLSIDGQLRAEQKSEALNGAIAGPMIARTVSLSLVVKDFAAARANLDAILRRHHGYAADLAANTAENAPRSLGASLRVPAAELDAALADLKAIGKVEREAQSGEEVTQQHADLVARLKNSRETEVRLQEILVQRTGKIKDVLEVEQEIARVRGEIEQMEAQQKSLEHRVEFATVNLALNEEYKEKLVSPAISAGTRLHNALVEGYREASETVLGIALFFAEYTLTMMIWGLILVLPAILPWRRYRRALATA